MTGASTTRPPPPAARSPLPAEPHGDRRRLPLVAGFLRLTFAALLLATGLAKLLDLPGFAAVVVTYRALPDALVTPAAALLTAVEIALGALLLTGRRLPEAALATVALHLGYLAWLAVALARGLNIPNCGCFGVYLPRPLTAGSLAEDGVITALALALYLAARPRRPPA